MRLISRENALCSVQSESWVSHTKASEQARADVGSRSSEAVPLLPSAMYPERQILLEMICCWLYSMLGNRRIVPQPSAQNTEMS